MRSFLKKILFFSIGLILIIGLTSYIMVKNNNAVYQYLYRYQSNKIEQSSPIETILIGDSTLGNAIDSEEFSTLSSKSTINCAMTGLYGYAGSYNILKKAYSHHPEIKNVIIMQATNMQIRDLSYAGYVRTLSSADDFLELSASEKFKFSKELYHYVKSIRIKDLSKSENLIRDDYIKQGPQGEFIGLHKPYSIEDININKNTFLARIVDFCNANNLNLIYVHGPMYKERALSSQNYIHEINKVISKTGVQLIPDVIAIEASDLGDTEEHIKPTLKKKYTKLYYEQISEYLE